MKDLLTSARSWRMGLSAAAALLVFSAVSAEAAVGSLAPLAAAATGQAGFGTIKGRLVWDGGEVPPRKLVAEKGKAPKDEAVCAKNAAIPSDQLVVDPKSKGVQFGFAYLPKPTGENPEAVKALVSKEMQVVIDQKNCRFVPHAIALNEGQSVLFKSSDPTNHNIRFTAFVNAAFNQILPGNGEVEKKLVPERLPIKLVCDIHPWMEGYMMVFKHPFFAVTGEDGSFEIHGVPAGMQNIVVWQETVGYVTQGAGRGMAVDVPSGGTVDLGEIKLKPKNK